MSTLSEAQEEAVAQIAEEWAGHVEECPESYGDEPCQCEEHAEWRDKLTLALRDLARKVAEEERERAVSAVERLATQASEPPTFTEIFAAIRGAR